MMPAAEPQEDSDLRVYRNKELPFSGKCFKKMKSKNTYF